MRKPLPRIAAIHDLSGFGRTSLTVVIPVFSAMGIQVCPLPTAVLSTQTSMMENFRFVDLSAAMRDFLAHWRELGLKFDAVYSGFLGSAGQAETVIECIDNCLESDGLVVVDPVLGDNGTLDPTMNQEMVECQRRLITRAHCITPNLTEAALLLGENFPEAARAAYSITCSREAGRTGWQSAHAPLACGGLSQGFIKDWLRRLAARGPEMVVITSVPLENGALSSVVAYNRKQERFWKVDCEYIPAFYPGTGDTFTSVLTSCLLLGESLPIAMDRAVQFVTMGIRSTFGYELPGTEGILLEKVLGTLKLPFTGSRYELLE